MIVPVQVPIAGGGTRSVTDMRRPSPRPVAQGFPWKRLVFGYTIDEANSRVRIYNGRLQWSDQGFATVADTNVTIAGASADYYVGVTFNGTTLAIPSASTAESTFRSDSTAFRTWLYKFTRTGASIYLAEIGHMGIIELDASFG